MESSCTHAGYETAMSYDVEEAVQDWVLSLSRSEIDSYLSRMELCLWVLGIYVPEEFQNPGSSDEVIARRKTLWEELRRIVKEEDATFLNTTSWDVHPLEVVLKSEAILEILTKTAAEAASSPQHPQHSEHGARRTSETSEHELIEDDDDIEQLQETQQVD